MERIVELFEQYSDLRPILSFFLLKNKQSKMTEKETGVYKRIGEAVNALSSLDNYINEHYIIPMFIYSIEKDLDSLYSLYVKFYKSATLENKDIDLIEADYRSCLRDIINKHQELFYYSHNNAVEEFRDSDAYRAQEFLRKEYNIELPIKIKKPENDVDNLLEQFYVHYNDFKVKGKFKTLIRNTISAYIKPSAHSSYDKIKKANESFYKELQYLFLPLSKSQIILDSIIELNLLDKSQINQVSQTLTKSFKKHNFKLSFFKIREPVIEDSLYNTYHSQFTDLSSQSDDNQLHFHELI